MDLPLLTHKDATLVLASALQAEVSVMLYGGPGIGKTQVVQAAARDAGKHCYTVNAPQIDSIDLRGIPYVEKYEQGAGTHWAAPFFMNQKPDSSGILFLDEITSAMPAVAVACMQLLLERRIGDAILPKGWQVVGAGNTAEDNTIAYELPAPARNRLLQFKLQVDPTQWQAWAVEKGIDERIRKFLNEQPSFLAGKLNVLNAAFPSPRSWELLSRMLRVVPQAYIKATAEGLVGLEAATHFMTFLQKKDAPSITPEMIRRNPKGVNLPTFGEMQKTLSALATTATSAHIMTDVAFLARLNNEQRQVFVSLAPPHLQKDYSEWLKVAK